MKEKPCISTNIICEVIDNSRVALFNKITKKSYFIGTEEYKLLVCADGVLAICQIAEQSKLYTVEQVENLFLKFSELEFLASDSKEKKGMVKEGKFRYKCGILNGNKLFRADSFITKIISSLLLYCSLIIFFTSVMNLTLNYNPQWFSGMAGWENALAMLPVIWISISLHEFGHAAIARRFNIPVPEIGLMIFFFIPYIYTNLSFITMLPKRKKLQALFGGMYVNMTIAGCCWLAVPYVGENISVFLLMCGVTNITLIITNMIIFFKLDGYFIFQEMIGERDLYNKSMKYVKTWLMNKIASLRFKKRIGYNLINGGLQQNQLNNIFYFLYGSIAILYVPVLLVTAIANIISYFI